MSGFRSGVRIRQALLTGYFGAHTELLPTTLPTLTQYAERNGHDLILAAPAGDDLHFDYAKVAALRRILPAYEAAIWIDGDSVILGDAPDLGPLLDDAWMAIGCDAGGLSYSTRLWALRRGERAVALLEALWGARCREPLDGWEGVLARTAGPLAPDVHRLEFPQRGQWRGVTRVSSARTGGLGVVHAGTERGLPHAVDVLTRVVEANPSARYDELLEDQLIRIRAATDAKTPLCERECLREPLP